MKRFIRKLPSVKMQICITDSNLLFMSFYPFTQ